MTDAMQRPLSNTNSGDVANTNSGDVAFNQTTLLRGGEALALEPVVDRFALSFAPGKTGSEIQSALGSATLTPILGQALFELQAEPDRLRDLVQALWQSGQMTCGSPVYELRCSPGTLVYPTDQLTIQFRESLTSERMQQIAASAGLRILKLISGVPKAFVFQIRTTSIVNPLQLAAALMQNSEIVLVEPNVAVMIQPCYRPRESDYGKQWYLHHEGGEGLAAGSHIFAEAAWNMTRGKRSITVAVVDTQIDLTHPDFQSEGKIVAPADLQARNAPAQNDKHGTAIAQIAVADETGKGMVGVAPGCALMPIRIGPFIDDQTIEQISQWAIDKGADVLCCGWNAAAIYFPLSLRQRVALTQAATQGRDGRGCVIVFAAGNANRPIDGVVNEQGWTDQVLQGNTRWLNGFAVHPDVLTVAACNSLNQKSMASNWGNGISVVAPSGSGLPMIYSQRIGQLPTTPQVTDPQTGRSLDWNSLATAATSVLLGGTSAASAIVAGVAALVLSINPDLTAETVRQILEQTADRMIDRLPDPQLGLSLGGYDENRYSAWFGYGKVNAIKAVQMAQRLSMPLPLPYRWVTYAQSKRLEIPDGNAQGITSTIQVAAAELVCDIEVVVDIEHDFLGDLELSLIPPWGKAIPLQSRSLGRLTSLKTTYSLENTLWLKTVLNRSAQGNWQLKLVDAIPSNQGYLRRWQLNLGV